MESIYIKKHSQFKLRRCEGLQSDQPPEVASFSVVPVMYDCLSSAKVVPWTAIHHFQGHFLPLVGHCNQ